MDDLRAGRGNPWDHDPGPPRNRSWARLFAETPDLRALTRVSSSGERVRWPFGPVFYRGRLGDRQVKVLVVGQDPGPDEALAHRAFVGESGTRLQHLLAHLGITRSYLFLNTFDHAITGQYDDRLQQLAQDRGQTIAPHRNRLLDYAASRNDLRLVIAVGRAARESVLTWRRARGGTGSASAGKLHSLDGTPLGPHVRMIDVMHPGAATQGATAEVAASFAAAVRRILRWAADKPAWLAPDPDGDRGSASAYAYGRMPVPLHDLPFGAPWRLGSGGTASTRRDGGRSIELDPGVRQRGGADYPREPAGAGRAGYDDEPGDLAYEPPRAVVEFDRGPDEATARLLVGGRPGLPWPDFEALGVPGAATYGGGPVYRGRFVGVRLLVVADQAGHDDLVWGRAFTGEAGQRFQALLAALGITRSYLIVRTLPVDTAGLSAGKVWALADRPDVVALHRVIAGRVLDDGRVSAVVTVGPHAERIAGRFDLDGQPVVSLPAWGSAGARDAWRQGHARLRSLGIPIDQTPTAATYDGERAQIPRTDLPYGFARWQGSSGDRVVRSRRAGAAGDGGPGDDADPPAYKVFVPGWVAALAPER